MSAVYEVGPSSNGDGQAASDADSATASKNRQTGSESRRIDAADSAAETADSCDLSLDSIFFTLSNSRRRSVIYSLKHADGPVEIGRLSRVVAAVENEVHPDEVTYQQRKRVYTSLHQLHLPKMDELGVVNFDQRAGTVEPANGLEELDIYLEVVPGQEISWSEFYLGFGVLSVGVAILAGANILPFGLVPGPVYLGTFAVVLVVASVLHWRQVRTQSFEEDIDTAILEEL